MGRIFQIAAEQIKRQIAVEFDEAAGDLASPGRSIPDFLPEIFYFCVFPGCHDHRCVIQNKSVVTIFAPWFSPLGVEKNLLRLYNMLYAAIGGVITKKTKRSPCNGE